MLQHSTALQGQHSIAPDCTAQHNTAQDSTAQHRLLHSTSEEQECALAAACSAQHAKRTAAQHSMYLCRIACQLLSSGLPKSLAIPHGGKLGILIKAPATVIILLYAVLLMALATAFSVALGVCRSFPLGVRLLIASVIWLARLASGGGGGGSSSGGSGVMPGRPPC